MQAAVNNYGKMMPTMIVLAISTILNAIYFMKTVVRIYSPERDLYKGREGFVNIPISKQKLYTVTIIIFIALNVALGLCSDPILNLISLGIDMFA